MDYKEVYEQWLSNPYFDEATKEELKNIAEDDNEIKERFYMDLEFGTAGLRGIIGAGTNRMNIYVVRRATQGLANYIAKVDKKSQGVAIAYDSRHMSPEFAEEAALCLACCRISIPGSDTAFQQRHLFHRGSYPGKADVLFSPVPGPLRFQVPVSSELLHIHPRSEAVLLSVFPDLPARSSVYQEHCIHPEPLLQPV